MRSEFHFFYLVRTSITPKPEVMATREKARDALTGDRESACPAIGLSASYRRTNEQRMGPLRHHFSAPFKDILYLIWSRVS
jgi:hypothetical protein